MAHIGQELRLHRRGGLGFRPGRHQRFFLFDLHGDVADDIQESDRLARDRIPEAGRRGFHPHPGAAGLVTGPPANALDRRTPLLPHQNLQHPPGVIGVDVGCERLAKQFLGFETQLANGRTEIGYPAVAVGHGDDVRGVLGDHPIAAFAAGQGRLGGEPPGQVLDLHDEVLGGSIRLARQGDSKLNPDIGTVQPPGAPLARVVVDLAGQQPVMVFLGSAKVFGMAEICAAQRQQLGLRIAGQAAKGGVHAQESPVYPHQALADRRLLEGGFEQLRLLVRQRLGCPAIGDIAENAHDLDRRARLVEHDVRGALDPYPLAVRLSKPVFAVEWRRCFAP